MNPANIP